MNTVMTKIKRLGKIRRFSSTVIHQAETIKPSVPTPPHLKIHKLSMIDHIVHNVHIPYVFFYKNYKSCDINILKKALSKCLTQYYPFAGRCVNAPSSRHIDCNDEGVEFLEASTDIPLHDFILKRDVDETILNKLIPNGLGDKMLEVQLNHFPCGGAAVAVSVSHKIADGFTVANFVNHWATVTRGESPINPSFISSTIKDTHHNLSVGTTDGRILSSKGKIVSRRFVFPESKLGELKKKINGMGVTPLNPSRVEALSSLLFKCAVDAATKKSGSLQFSNLSLVVNMREKVSTICPNKTAAGNIFTTAIAMMADSGEIKLNEVITSLRKDRSEIRQVRDVEEVSEMFLKKILTIPQDNRRRTYSFSSMCRLPFYQVDFGWGKPERVIFASTCILESSLFFFMDIASGDGVEAILHLEEGEMDLQNHKELLVYVEDN